MIADTVNQLSSKWWTFLVRGILALILAAACLIMPGATAAALVIVVAAYFIVTGAVAIAGGFSFTGLGHWWALVIMGLVQIALGVIMLLGPGMGALALAYLFAVWMIMTGVTEISSAMAFRNLIGNEFWWILLGIITLAWGFYVVLVPALGLLALVYTIGFYAILAGISLIGFSVRLKGLPAELHKHGLTA